MEINADMAYIVATVLTFLSVIALVAWNYFTRDRRRSTNLVKKGDFGFPIPEWKDVQKEREEFVKKYRTEQSSGSSNKKEKSVTFSERNKGDQLTSGEEKEPWIIDHKELIESGVRFEDKKQENEEDLKNCELPNAVKVREATRKIEKSMTDDQKAEENQIKKQQMEHIFELLKENEDKFGSQSNEDFQEQMKLYAF